MHYQGYRISLEGGRYTARLMSPSGVETIATPVSSAVLSEVQDWCDQNHATLYSARLSREARELADGTREIDPSEL